LCLWRPLPPGNINNDIMHTDYQRLCAYLSQADASALRSTTMDEICARFNISTHDADLCFYTDFGMSGEEIIAELLLL